MNSLLLAVLAAGPASAQLRTAPVPVRVAPAVPGMAAAAPLAAPAVGRYGAPTSLTLTAPALPSAAAPRAAALSAVPAALAAAAQPAVGAAPAARPASAALPASAAAPAALAALGAPMAAASLAAESAPGAAPSAAPKADAAGLDELFDGTKGMRRPLVEQWTVEGKSYRSTRSLLQNLPDSPVPVRASFEFGRHTSVLPRERAANTAFGGLTGLVAGGVGGAVFSLVGGLAGSVLGLFLFGDPTGGLAMGEGVLVAGVFAGAGALMGLFIGWEEGGKPWRGSASGEIFRHGGRVLFRTGGDRKRAVVDLEAFAQAPHAADEPATAPWPVWKTALYGAGLAGLAALATGFPLVQVVGLWVAGPALGLYVGRALSAGGEVRGGVLAGALGTLLPATMFFALAVGSATGDQLLYLVVWALAVTGLGGVFGALSGNRVRAGLARREADYPAAQWWSPDR